MTSAAWEGEDVGPLGASNLTVIHGDSAVDIMTPVASEMGPAVCLDLLVF